MVHTQIHLKISALSILLSSLFCKTSGFTHSFWLPPVKFASKSTTELPSSSSSDNAPSVRFLGKGERAVVRPGVVLVAPNHEYNHYLMRSAVFIHGIGVDDEGQHVTRGVIIDQPTAFSMGEMGGGSVYGLLAQNILFQGGDVGNDSAMLLHSCGKDMPCMTEEDTASRIECGDMIGMSGIYEGGLQTAMDKADDGLLDPEKFKFFFNYVEFTDMELELMLQATDSEGDAWFSVEVSPDMILGSEYSRGDAWKYLRRQLKKITV